jgi:hypothetical protein
VEIRTGVAAPARNSNELISALQMVLSLTDRKVGEILRRACTKAKVTARHKATTTIAASVSCPVCSSWSQRSNVCMRGHTMQVTSRNTTTPYKTIVRTQSIVAPVKNLQK